MNQTAIKYPQNYQRPRVYYANTEMQTHALDAKFPISVTVEYYFNSKIKA